MPVLQDRSEPLEPTPDGKCPLCGSDLLYSEMLLVRQETRVASLVTEEFPEVGEVWTIPLLTGESDALVTERLTAVLSCSGVACEYVFDTPFLGEPEDAPEN